MKWNIIIFITLLLNSCTNKTIYEISPSEYEFVDNYMQEKWNYFLSLNNCKKIEFLDSIYRPIVIEDKRIWDSSLVNSRINRMMDSTLINDTENFYHWVFREIEELTGRRASQKFIQHYGYRGITNIQFSPGYESKDPVTPFLADIRAWKDSLGCD